MPFIPTLPTASSGFNTPTLQQTASNIKVRLPDNCVTCGHQIFVGMLGALVWQESGVSDIKKSKHLKTNKVKL